MSTTPTTTTLEQEIDLNWQEYPSGTEAFLLACRNGKIKGTLPVSGTHPNCGCAYGHISGLDEPHAWELIYKRREHFCSTRSGYTFLEEEVLDVRPGQNLNNPRIRALHDLILARKPGEKGA